MNQLRAHYRPLAIVALSLLVAFGTLALSEPVSSQGPGGPGQCCTNFCGMEPPCGGDIILNCSDFGMTGTWPLCDFPTAPTCADSGLLGTYPNCYPPPQPTCADSGLLGTYPNCYAPPQPTCSDYGQLGTYPNCYAPPQPSCSDVGLLGSWPNCYPPPQPTCADSGLLGTYPNCYEPPQTCTPDTSCAANTCAGSYCSDGCGNSVPGVMSCPAGGDDDDDDDGGGACQNSGPVSIDAAPNRVQPGGSTVLSWSGSRIGATECTITNVNTGVPVEELTVSSCGIGSDTTPVSDITAQTTFRLECGSLFDEVIVNIVPRYEEF